MKTIIKMVIIITAMLLHASAWALDATKVENFFNRYVELNEKFDVSVSSMYSDKAKIHTFRRYPHGLERAVKLTGSQLKDLLNKGMPVAKQRGDISKYDEIQISIYGNQAKIKAKRYSVLKCYTDKAYYMVVEEVLDGGLQIVEEYTETQPQSECTNSDDLNVLLQNAKAQLEGSLPVMVDEDTRLDDVFTTDNIFQYQYTLVNVTNEELDLRALDDSLKPIVQNQACTMPNLKSLAEKGAIISFLYNDKNGNNTTTINIEIEDCTK